MGDSDDEFGRRRRDKFRRERDDFDSRREDRGRERGQWDERGRMNWEKRDRRDYREFDRRRDRYSPNDRDDISPPVKRFRGGEWENRGGNYSHFEGGFGGGGHHHGNWGGNHGDMGPPGQNNFGNQNRGQEPDYPTQPPMMSFKQFLSTQDDNITDEEAIRKYNEYKIDFKKQQINEFFLAHKEEEWFKAKYSPEEFDKHQEESRLALKHRCSVFNKLLELGRVDNISVDVDKSDGIVKLLDAAVILMEGGTEFDLKILDMEPKPEETTNIICKQQISDTNKKVEEEKQTKEDGEEKEGEEEEGEEKKKSDVAEDDVDPEDKKDEIDEKESPKKKKKKKRDYESGSESDSWSSSESEMEVTPVADEAVVTSIETVDKPLEQNGDTSQAENKISNEDTTEVSKTEDKEQDTQEEGEHKDQPKPQAFHKTHSIFLRNLAPTITKQEVEAMCKRYPGFLRVALQDPQPERRFFRRGWVTFDRTVNIKDICWNLNNIRLRDCEMGAIVNRELKQRVRPVSGITAHKTVTKQDIKHAAKIVQNFDNRWNIWADDEEKKDEEKEPAMVMGLVSSNPVLKNITDYLVDEGSYEEEAYFGECIDDKPKDGNTDITVERDDELCKVLDKMILYLRIVHSFDYYSCVEYPKEDEMPHRCGIIHARGSAPNNKVSQQELEKFVKANTQELAKDKWLCPLSGKKFKGPEFVRKHLFNKHAEKVEEVKQEVAYFNNYLLDPKRPHLPEHPSSRQGAPPPPMYRQDSGGYNQQGVGVYQTGFRGNMGGGGGGGGNYNRPMYNNYQGYHHSTNYHNRGGGGGGGGHDYRQDYRRDRGGGGAYFRRDRGRQDPRGLIEYRDLDAPDDNDIF
ncbi:hypothetical protein LSH36_45g11011 [Paralvinella palmiformis]|uniref:Serrate RNA effector molecule homolog n=1 Tax=Paralvinella palmiformis TaxID=53620 RepID=A0AAD9NG14_9ANNE|nr:hypothetical protein LSH36_45g11011 [Paralvinella palmiformis]